MKIAALYFLFLLCTLAGMSCWLLQVACRSLYKLFRRCSLHMDKAKRKLIARYNNNTMHLKAEPEWRMPPPPGPAGIVGGSKTLFMNELPVLRKPEEEEEEIKPFKSEPLVIIIEEPDEAQNEPDGFDIESGNGIPDDDMDSFEYHDGEEMNNSSGVSFEELSKTISVLHTEELSDNDKENAVNVLNAINNTGLFQFITINSFVYENAKILMDSFNNKNDPVNGFNINDFVE